jgi:sec-independent protein translocase protein TatB
MFGMGGTEILVILIVALLFLGPDKLPEAAKQISKGIRDLRKQTRAFQETIENDERIGGAIRDIKSALNGEEPRPRVRPAKPLPPADAAVLADMAAPDDAATAALPDPEQIADGQTTAEPAPGPDGAPSPARGVTLPPTAGEGGQPADDTSDLAAMIKPAEGAIAKGSANGHG